MNTIDQDKHHISEIVTLYFRGTYLGDPALLKQAFHEDAHISGNINGKTFDWSRPEFIDRVTVKPTAATANEIYDKNIIFIDITNDAAIVKAKVIVKGLIFVDYITLLKIEGQWIIRNKSFTTTAI